MDLYEVFAGGKRIEVIITARIGDNSQLKVGNINGCPGKGRARFISDFAGERAGAGVSAETCIPEPITSPPETAPILPETTIIPPDTAIIPRVGDNSLSRQ